MKFCAPVIVSIVSTRFWTPDSFSRPPAPDTLRYRSMKQPIEAWKDDPSRFVIVAQVRPTTGQTVYPTDLVGSLVDEGTRPSLPRAFCDGEIVDGDAQLLGSEEAAHVNGQILGRTEYAYTLFQQPKQIAWMWKDGGWTLADVAAKFDATLGQHLQTVGMVMPKSMEK